MRKLKIFIIFLLLPLLIFPQTKEIIQSLDKSVIFKEGFQDVWHIRKNGGSINGSPVFNNGTATFDGTNDYLNDYYIEIPAVVTIRARLRFPTGSVSTSAVLALDGFSFFFMCANNLIFCSYSGNDQIWIGSIDTYWHDYVYTNNGTHGEIFIDGVSLGSKALTSELLNGLFGIAGDKHGNYKLNAQLDLLEIYNRVLTDEEIYNISYDLTYKVPTFTNTLIDFDALQGVCRDSHNDLTLTDVEVKRVGKWYAPLFNGSTSKVDVGSDVISTKAITIMGWIKPYSNGENNISRIITNNNFRIETYSSGDRLLMTSNEMQFIMSAVNSIKYREWNFISLTRKLDGKATFYIGNLDSTPIISGTADQNSGLPEPGTSNIFIGNRNSSDRTFDGYIQSLIAIEDVVSYTQIVQYWSSTKTWIE